MAQASLQDPGNFFTGDKHLHQQDCVQATRLLLICIKLFGVEAGLAALVIWRPRLFIIKNIFFYVNENIYKSQKNHMSIVFADFVHSKPLRGMTGSVRDRMDV